MFDVVEQLAVELIFALVFLVYQSQEFCREEVLTKCSWKALLCLLTHDFLNSLPVFLARVVRQALHLKSDVAAYVSDICFEKRIMAKFVYIAAFCLFLAWCFALFFLLMASLAPHSNRSGILCMRAFCGWKGGKRRQRIALPSSRDLTLNFHLGGAIFKVCWGAPPLMRIHFVDEDWNIILFRGFWSTTHLVLFFRELTVVFLELVKAFLLFQSLWCWVCIDVLYGNFVRVRLFPPYIIPCRGVVFL